MLGYLDCSFGHALRNESDIARGEMIMVKIIQYVKNKLERLLQFSHYTELPPDDAYKISTEEMDKVLELTKNGKVIVDPADYGVNILDAIMSFWAYVNGVAVYNLRYGCYQAWQDVGECADELEFERNLFFKEGTG